MEDTRCCGTGTCIINAEGYCWCGQRWNGERMCFPDPAPDQLGTPGATPTTDTLPGASRPATTHPPTH